MKDTELPPCSCQVAWHRQTYHSCGCARARVPECMSPAQKEGYIKELEAKLESFGVDLVAFRRKLTWI